ncbi:hypothetical protein Hypma_015691 [Hypsizygus marmoreus]|uniref:Uncharacterized protein n=1 Tax=Hypsizygus marmoreus TaxID=39966 RepID=A0A369KAG3_HYPMA|nr:hypothetical protein Hypma_015691 [Hypsizygus marmoreus]
MTSFGTSPGTKGTKKKGISRPRGTRSPSASEIARSLKNFETWSTHQGCEQVSFLDLPEGVKAVVHGVFDTSGRLPTAWINQDSKEYEFLAQFSTPEFMSFIRDAYKLCPALFSNNGDNHTIDIPELYTEVSIVFSAWRRLRWMRKSKEKWSEADYVANVYNVFRSPAIKESAHRVHCTISLPQPSLQTNLGAVASRILNTKTVVPDCSIFIPAASIRSLSHSAKSPFKMLRAHPTIVASGNTSKGSSFRYQSTPCANLPDTPGFEFASSFWEDKKPVHQLLEDAYRQNRMSTASAARQLHSLSIDAPIFGLVWASGTVRAHVDWCQSDDGKPPAILSAPYPGVSTMALGAESGEDMFHEWQLDQPSDILAVYFLIRNLDRWTTKGFRDRIIHGVSSLVDNVTNKGMGYRPWKRAGDLLAPALVDVRKENISTSTSTDPSSTPPVKVRSRKHRTRDS